ncbi:hypothetical protein EJF18_60231 [Clavispora lusitaniae]|uniref:Uncharacterized protein n=1 Tax=Clavispora lusitaniae TaxID=36911 RepID=A0ACD0WQC4_CLALS|nr:hypothetical protein EJF14_60231 [Clavispora lusitaniae]QFZ35369.1 hypothetical protein EJF16_60231 [Clavispora lusitaniae]QFZ41063.1 hypothetical protein EJF15_60231 [Clavispora lusitaniae]QFZ46744.1 hypothetical protein EJF18_60231 [Clavispora lusitaniae]QFZ52409.1 hypothetical protein EJF17_60231 [Clavispora lusitaniae]
MEMGAPSQQGKRCWLETKNDKQGKNDKNDKLRGESRGAGSTRYRSVGEG